MSEYVTAAELRDEAIYTPVEIGKLAQRSYGHIKKAIENERLRAVVFGRRMLRFYGRHARQWIEEGSPCEKRFTAQTMRDLIAIHGDREGHIYFAKCMDFVKIGFSSAPDERLLLLNWANPMEIDLIGTTPGSVLAEKAIHALLRERRHKLEWFRLAPDLDTTIRDLCACP